MLNTLRIVTTLVIFRGILGIQINFKKNFISQGHLLAEKSTWRPDYFRRLNLANFNVLNTNKDCYDMIFFKISLKYNLILFILTIMYFSTIVIINKLHIYPPPDLLTLATPYVGHETKNCIFSVQFWWKNSHWKSPE